MLAGCVGWMCGAIIRSPESITELPATTGHVSTTGRGENGTPRRTVGISELEERGEIETSMDAERSIFELLQSGNASENGSLIGGLGVSKYRQLRALAPSALAFWASINLEEARTWALSQNDEARNFYLGEMSWEWAKRDPEAVFDWIKSIPATERHKLLVSIGPATGELMKLMPERLVDLLLPTSSEVAAYATGTLFSEWARADPLAALKKAESVQRVGDRRRFLGFVVQRWAEKHPDAALNWLDSVSEPSLRDELLGQLLQGWSKINAKAAVDYVSRQTSTVATENALRQILLTWGGSNHSEALAWADGLKGTDSFQKVFTTVMQPFNGQPEIAGKLISDRLPFVEDPKAFFEGFLSSSVPRPPQYAERFIAAVAPEFKQIAEDGFIAKFPLRLYHSDFERWVTQLPEGRFRNAGIDYIVESHFWRYGMDLKEWIGKLPAGDSKDVAVFRASTLAFSNFGDTQAAEFARMHSTPEKAEETLAILAERWIGRNRGEAMEWLRKTVIFSTEQKKRLFRIE